MSKPRNLIIGTSGHIDHGKTSLVKALTNRDTDRLKEEKKRGITIELGFAPWQIAPDLTASIIDVPGHERLIRTMVSGAMGIDIGLLVVAADDGVMPQTQEHLDILTLLKIPQLVVVITKCDLVDDDLQEFVIDDVQETLGQTPFADAPVIAVSSHTSQGLEELSQTIVTLAKKSQTRLHTGPGYLSIDRVFLKEGYGSVVTGTLLRGQFKQGDTVEVLGEDERALAELKIRNLQAHGTELEEISAGVRTAINLTGKQTDKLKRGQVIANEGFFRTTDRILVSLKMLGPASGIKNATVSFHIGTTERQSQVIPLESSETEELEGAMLKLDHPVPLFAGQRFILRKPGQRGQTTIAGGEILDTFAPSGKGSTVRAYEHFAALHDSRKDRLLALTSIARGRGVTKEELHQRMPPGEIGRALEQLEKKGKVICVDETPPRWVDAEMVQNLTSNLVREVQAKHQRDPLDPGLLIAEAEALFPPPERPIVGTVIKRAIKSGKLAASDTHLAIPGQGSAVDSKTQKQMERILAVFEKNPLTPPSDDNVLDSLNLDGKEGRKVFSYLRRSHQLVKVADGQHYHGGHIETLKKKIIHAFANKESLTASELKEAIGGNISRKWAIPLFEYMDKEKVTIRRGANRILHPTMQKQTSADF